MKIVLIARLNDARCKFSRSSKNGPKRKGCVCVCVRWGVGEWEIKRKNQRNRRKSIGVSLDELEMRPRKFCFSFDSFAFWTKRNRAWLTNTSNKFSLTKITKLVSHTSYGYWSRDERMKAVIISCVPYINQSQCDQMNLE